MKPKLTLLICLLLISMGAVAQDTAQVLTISNKVGDVIDSTEKANYHLFPYWDVKDFQSAQFIQDRDLKIYAVGKMKNGTIKKMPVTQGAYNQLQIKTFDDTSSVKQLTEEEKLTKQRKAIRTGRNIVGGAFFLYLFVLLFGSNF